jgi:hypothetical protein
LKRIYVKDRTKADRLFVTESDLRHYITPWRSFPNGKMFFFESIQSLVDNLHASANWNHSKRVVLFFADCWDGGPDMTTLNGWQDFVEFDKWLRLSGDSIQARTRTDIAAEIHSRHEDAWQSWQLDRYVQCVQAIREAFSTAGKTVVISSQVVPMVAGVQGAEIACTYRGMADDSTWSMLENSPVLTTGRQLSLLAFNPVWEMTTLIAWGYNSSLFNPWQWHSPVGTAEPSRRHIYNRAWRATLWPDGRYASVYTYGYSQNVGTSFLMTEEDYQEWWYIQERHSLISPEAPIGAGILISTQKSSDPRHIRFNCGDPLVLEEALIVTKTFELLHNAGISIPFAANVSALPIWESTAPLIVLNLPDFSDNEVASLAAFHARGVPIVAFAERSSLTDEMSTLFSKPETLLIEIRCSSLTRIAIEQSATQLRGFLKQAVLFPPGTAGYGFRSQGVAYFVLEDWLEKTRPVDMLIAKSADARSATACSVNRHAQLQVTDAGAHWSVRLRLQSGDGELIALEERFS